MSTKTNTMDALWGYEGILDELSNERARQDTLWGEQNHENGTSAGWRRWAHDARKLNQRSVEDGNLTWEKILSEEFFEAISETDPRLLRAELIQVAAVAVNWIEAIDRRSAKLREEVEETRDAEGWYGSAANPRDIGLDGNTGNADV